jgi:hypothetical protein
LLSSHRFGRHVSIPSSVNFLIHLLLFSVLTPLIFICVCLLLMFLGTFSSLHFPSCLHCQFLLTLCFHLLNLPSSNVRSSTLVS